MQPTTGFIHAIAYLWLQGLNVRNVVKNENFQVVLRGKSIHTRLFLHMSYEDQPHWATVC